MNKITYLFGAGASCNVLPIVKEIPERINGLVQVLRSRNLMLDDKSTFNANGDQSQDSKRVSQLKLIDDLNWLLNESGNHSSVDTFAKKLTIRKKFDELERLKRVLSVFFIFEQARRPPDKRYDTFYASIISRSGKLPENIRIVSWNYDHQFELSYSEYSGEKKILRNQDLLNVIQKNGINNYYDQSFRIYKLNGTTDVIDNEAFRQYSYFDEIILPVNKEFVEKIVKQFALFINSKSLKSTISFAWEPEENLNEGTGFMDTLISDVKDCVALAVIGYSFPFFNREIDRKIIGSMNQLRRVYFQAPDAEVLKERFSAIRDDNKNLEFVLIKDVGQFILPNEL